MIKINKILLEIYVPLIEKKYEIFVPVSKSVEKVTKIINKSISELNDNFLSEESSFRLYDQQTGNLIPLNVTIKDSGLKNGSRVLFT